MKKRNKQMKCNLPQNGKFTPYRINKNSREKVDVQGKPKGIMSKECGG